MAPRNCTIGRRGGEFGPRALALSISVAASVACGLFGLLAAAPSSAFAQTAAGQTKTAQAKAAQDRLAAQKKQRRPAARAAQVQPRPAPPKAKSKGFIETIMEGPRLTTTPPEAADWVRATRRDPNAPRPIARPPGPGRPLLKPDQIRAHEAQLDRLRARHDRIAGRKPPTGKFGSAAGKPEAPPVEKYKPGCVLTCSNPIAVPRTQRR